jgi:hypothetical protein
MFRVVVAGIVRTVYLREVYGDNPDKTWLGFTVIVAGTIEGHLAIVCACAPSLKSCFRNFFHGNLSTGGSNTTGTTEYDFSKFNDPAQLKKSRSMQSKASWTTEPAYLKRSLSGTHEEAGNCDCGLGDMTPVAKEEGRERLEAPMLPLSWLDTLETCSDSGSGIAMPVSYLNLTTEEEDEIPEALPQTPKIRRT